MSGIPTNEKKSEKIKTMNVTSSSPLSGGDSVYDKLALVSTSFFDNPCTLTSFPCKRPRYPLDLRSSNDLVVVVVVKWEMSTKSQGWVVEVQGHGGYGTIVI